MAGLYLLNPKRRRRRRSGRPRGRRRNLPLSATMAWGMGNPRRRRRRSHKRRVVSRGRYQYNRRRRRNPVMAVYNPRRRRRGFLRRRSRRGGGGGGFGLGGLRKMFSPNFALQAVGAGLGVMAGVVVPNTFFAGQTWYVGWTKHAVRAALAVILAPIIGRLLPGALGSSFAVGAIAAVGVGVIGELLGQSFSIGPADTAQSLQTTFRFSGLGLYAPKMLRGPTAGPVGMVVPRLTRRTLGGGTVSDAIFGGSGIFSR